MCARYLLAGLFLTGALALTAQAQQARQITFDEAVRIALERNVTLKQTENNLEAQAAQVTAERGDFLPNLNFFLQPTQTYGSTFDQNTLGFISETTQSVSGSFSSSLNLFNGFADVASYRQAERVFDQRDYTYDRARQTVVFDVASTFLEVISNREQIGIREESLASQQQQLEQIEEFVNVGSRPVSDLYQQQAAVAQEEFQILEAQRQLQLSETRLIQVLQLDPFGSYTFVVPELSEEAPLTPEAYDVSTLLREAFARRADLRAQEAGIAAAEAGIRVARSGYLPTVSLNARTSGSYSSTAEDAFNIGLADQLFDNRRSESLSLSVNVPIFNRFEVNNQVQQAEVQYENAQLALEGRQQDVALQVRQAFLDYQTAVKRLDVTEKQLIASERALEAAQERYNVGATTLVELTQVRADYVQAASDRISARYTLLFQEKLIEYYTGTLDPSNPLAE